MSSPPEASLRKQHDTRTLALLAELRAALRETPPRIPTKLHYDRRGSQLFEAITALPEYYLTNAEAALLAAVSPIIAEATQAEEVVELGSGSGTKTRLLLSALAEAGTLSSYIPIDFSPSILAQLSATIGAERPGLAVHPIVADFTGPVACPPAGRRRLVLLLGSTIGNFLDPEAVRLLARTAEQLAPGDFFLLGVDLIKDVARLEAAYNDSAGVTAEFSRNILSVVNRIADADFEPEAWRHQAVWNPVERRMDVGLVAERPQSVALGEIDLTLEIAAGDLIRTEVCVKYDRERAAALLAAAGLRLVRWLPDDAGDFALALATL